VVVAGTALLAAAVAGALHVASDPVARGAPPAGAPAHPIAVDAAPPSLPAGARSRGEATPIPCVAHRANPAAGGDDVGTDAEARAPRPGTERACLLAFLRACRTPGADAEALARETLAGDATLPAQLAVLRGLRILRHPSEARVLADTSLGADALDAAHAAALRQVASSRLVELARDEPAGRAELARLLPTTPAAGVLDATEGSGSASLPAE
jgi:hypothetical protein